MHASRLLLLALVCTLIGCICRDPSIDLLESELRWMEDQVYVLEDELSAATTRLADCQSQACTPAAERKPTSILRPRPANDRFPNVEKEDDDEEADLPVIEMPADPPGEPAQNNSRQTPIYEKIDEPNSAATKQQSSKPMYTIEPLDRTPQPDYEIVEPSVEYPPDMDLTPPESVPTPMESTPSLPTPGARPLLDIPPKDGTNGTVELQSFYWDAPPQAQTSSNLDAHVTHIVMQGTISDGYDFDNEPCPPGVLVVVQPRNAAGEFVALAGPVSVVVLDGKHQGTAARLARWDLDAADCRRKLRESSLGAGIHLVLPWPDDPPDSKELYLFVRYTNVEGRKLEADMQLDGKALELWKAPRHARSTSTAIQLGSESRDSATVPLSNRDKIELRPIPRDDAITPAAHQESASNPSRQELPKLRKPTRPEWQPHR